MRCREVKRWIDQETGSCDADVSRHIAACPACARAAEATGILRRGFQQLKPDLPIPPFQQLRSRIELMPNRAEGYMSRLKYQVRERPRWIFCGAIVVSAILMVMVIPFSYTHTAGYQVTFPVMASESRVPPRLVAAALTTIGYENVTLSPSAGGSSNAYAVRKLESPGEAESVAALFSAMTGHQGKPKIEPVVVKVSTTLYSQAVEKLKPRRRIPLRIENRDGGEVIINGRRIRDVVFDTELSDARIEEEMRKIFGEEDQEAEDIKVTVETNAGKTERTVRVELFPEQPKPEGKVPTISIGLKRKSMSIFLVKADDSVSAEAGPAFELGLADKKAEAKIHKMRFRVIEFRIDLQ